MFTQNVRCSAQNGCVGQIRIGTTDKDNDLISCRWAKGTTECSSICHGNRANSFVTVDEVNFLCFKVC